MLVEVWKYIEESDGYKISNLGRVKSPHNHKGAKILAPRLDIHGYTRVYLRCSLTGKRKDYKIHRLVAKYFVPNLDNKPIVNHLDGNKSNNVSTNLVWCTHSENNKHAYTTGLSSQSHRGKPVTINGVYYPSISKASEKLGVTRQAIQQWIRKGKCN